MNLRRVFAISPRNRVKTSWLDCLLKGGCTDSWRNANDPWYLTQKLDVICVCFSFSAVSFIYRCWTWRRCLSGEAGCSQACPLVRLTVVQLNLKPEALLSALLLTNNEIQRDSWEDVSTIEPRGVLSTARIENIYFSGWKFKRIETSRPVA